MEGHAIPLSLLALIKYDLNPIYNTKYTELPGHRQIEREQARSIYLFSSVQKRKKVLQRVLEPIERGASAVVVD